MLSKSVLPVRAAAGAALFLFAFCGVSVATARAQTAAPPPAKPAPSLTPKSPYWREIAESRTIFTGKVIALSETREGNIPDPVFRVFRIHALRDEPLKGAPALVEPLRATPDYWFTFQTDDDKEGDYVEGLSRFAKVVFFDNGAQARHTPVGVISADVAAIKAEIVNQTLLAARFAELPAARPDRFHTRVASLIAQIRDDPDGDKARATEPPRPNSKMWEAATDELLRRMGKDAVPSLIRQMNDPRPLPVGAMRFVDSLGFKHENGSPQYVTDLLVALAPTILTWERPKFRIYSGATETERRAAVDGWRVWLCYTMAEAEAKKKRPKAQKPLQ